MARSNIRYATAGPMADITETAASVGNFRTLMVAMETAGLAPALKGPGPFTLFAPTDEAFGRLVPGTVGELLRDPAKLGSVLTYHLLPNRLRGCDALAMTQEGDEACTPAVRGTPLRVHRDGRARRDVLVNDVTVVSFSIEASNGIIHGVDRLMLTS